MGTLDYASLKKFGVVLKRAQILCDIEKQVNNETYHFQEFIRFKELENGTLFGRINPKSAVLPFMADHFENRISGERWVIADTVHHTVLIHDADQHALYASMSFPFDFANI